MNLHHKKNENYTQTFILFSEESWNQNAKNYKKNIDLFFSGKKFEVFIDVADEKVIYFIGTGKNNAQDFEYQQIATKFSQSYKKNFVATPTFISAENCSENQFSEFYKGLYLGTYSYPFSKNHTFWDSSFKIDTDSINNENLEVIQKKTEALFEAQTTCQEWLNKPANFKTPDLVSDFLKELSSKNNLKYTVFNRQKCKELGLGAFLSVNQGSAYDAAFTILEYKSSQKDAKTIGLVGKCVLFDTGGISIKPSDNMHYMKSDMGGATAVIGALMYASKMNLPVNIVAILPITDNAISEKAYLPSDVVTAYNGKTIEVLNTDAEGRMTLADALSYITKNYETDVLIDLATLTGSAVRMFGDTCGALFSNNEDLKNKLIKTGDKTNQRLWNLPLWDIWNDDFKSDVADFKNISMKPIGDCIIAAKFLEQFLENHQNWAHLDIAGVAFGNVGYAKDKAATGYGVQLLSDFIENY